MDKKESSQVSSNKKHGFFTKSVRNQILFPFLLLIIVASGVIAFVSYYLSFANTTETLTENVESQMTTMDNTFEMFFTDMESILKRMGDSDTVIDYEEKEYDELLHYYAATQETTEEITSIYSVEENSGDVVIFPEADLGDDFDGLERDWYKNGKAADGDIVWTEPYIDASTGEVVTTASKAYFKDDDFVGVVAADILVGTLIDMINETEIGETGYGVILNQEGEFIAHPDEEMIGETEADNAYFQQIAEGADQGTVSFKENGKEKAIAYVTNPTTDWIVGGKVNKKDFKELAQSIVLPIAGTLIVTLLIAVFISLKITKAITVPIQHIMSRMTAIAKGDLSHDDLHVKYDNEIGQLVSATNGMQRNMRHILEEIHRVSETVSGQSEQLTQSAGDVKTGTEQIASTMEELANGSETQANSASDLSSLMTDFTLKVSETNQHGEDIQKNSVHVLDMTEKGNELMNRSTEQMEKIDAIVKDAVDKMQSLDNHSQEITKLVAVIKGIADQTNLLALNAAIEAARAGEHGKGFAVVADEVRKLAEQVALSVDDITGIVSNIQHESSIAVSSLLDGYQEVEEGTAQIDTTGETFQAINNAVTDMASHIKHVAENLSEMATNSEHINRSIEDIAAVTEESAAGVEETAASAEESFSSMEEVSSSSKHLAKLAEELNHVVGQFKI